MNRSNLQISKILVSQAAFMRAWLAFVMVFAIVAATASSLAAPVIYSASETALPGEVVGIRGEFFGAAPTVKLGVVSGGSVAWQSTLSPINVSDSFVSVAVPETAALNMYVFAVQDSGGAISGNVFVNRVRPTHAEFPEVCPNGTFRIFGRNLRLGNGTPQVWFVNSQTQQETAATVLSGTDPYILNIQAPGTVVPGVLYSVGVCNGYGELTGRADIPELLTVRAGGSDLLGLGVPWGNDFSFANNVYNVKTDSRLTVRAMGDGVTDDAAAIQAAINTANASGGGVVYLPSATYRLSSCTNTAYTVSRKCYLQMKSNVVLEGDGAGASILSFDNCTAQKQFMIYSGSGSCMGIKDLGIESNATSVSQELQILFSNISKVFMTGVDIDLNGWGAGVNFFSSNRVLVSDSAFRNPLLAYAQTLWIGSNNPGYDSDHAIIRNCQFPNWTASQMMKGKNLIIENCFFQYNTDYVASLLTGGQSLGWDIDSITVGHCSNNVVLSNTFQTTGTATYQKRNDGEGIRVHMSSGESDRGTVTSASSQSITDSAKTWTANRWGRIVSEWHYVTVLSGRGVGQTRRIVSNTATTLTLDQPWQTVPDASSVYAITLMCEELLIKGNVSMNRLGSKPWAIYGGKNIAIVGNVLQDAAGIVVAGLGHPNESTSWTSSLHVVDGVCLADNHVSNPSGHETAFLNITVATSGTGYSNTPFVFGAEMRQNQVEVTPLSASTITDATYDSGLTSCYAGSLAPFFDPSLQSLVLENNELSGMDTAYRFGRSSAKNIVFGAHDPSKVPARLYKFAHEGQFNFRYPDTYPLWGQGAPVFGSDAALAFDGNDFVDLRNRIAFPASLTIEAWIRTTATGSQSIIGAGGGTNPSRVFGCSSGQLFFRSVGATPSTVYSGTGCTINDGQWHHVAVTTDGINTSFYKDGVLVTTFAQSQPSAATVFQYTNLGASTGYGFSGSLQDVRIWGKAVPSSSLLTNYNRRLAGTEANLLAYFRLNEGIGASVFGEFGQDEDVSLEESYLFPRKAFGALNNAYRQIISGTNTSITVPQEISSDAVSADGGSGHTLVATWNGAVYAWGRNDSGQLGNGTSIALPGYNSVPTQVAGVSNATAVTAGAIHSLALTGSGAVYAWGNNSYGAIGNNTVINALSAVNVSGVSNIVAIAAGQYHSVGLRSDGTVWTWGRNNWGQLGIGGTANSLVPVQIPSITNAVAVDAFSYGTLILKADGTVWACGLNQFGDLGDGTVATRTTPVQVKNVANAISIASAGEHGLAVCADGTCYSWGRNDNGQVGDGTQTHRYLPVALAVPKALMVAASANNGYVVTRDRKGHAWGVNTQGQCLDGTTTSPRLLPVDMIIPRPIHSISSYEYNLYFLAE